LRYQQKYAIIRTEKTKGGIATNAYSADALTDMFRRNAGYLYRVAQCHGGTAARTEQILHEALWYVYTRHGATRKKAAFRAAVVRGMKFAPEGDRWSRMEGLSSGAGEAFEGLEVDVKRAVLLHFECGWTEREAAKACRMSAPAFKRMIGRLEAEPGGQDLADELHACLLRSSAPDTGRIIRAFSERAAQWKRPRRWGRKILKILFSTAIILLLCVLFWLAAVLLND